MAFQGRDDIMSLCRQNGLGSSCMQWGDSHWRCPGIGISHWDSWRWWLSPLWSRLLIRSHFSMGSTNVCSILVAWASRWSQLKVLAWVQCHFLPSLCIAQFPHAIPLCLNLWSPGSGDSIGLWVIHAVEFGCFLLQQHPVTLSNGSGLNSGLVVIVQFHPCFGLCVSCPCCQNIGPVFGRVGS